MCHGCLCCLGLYKGFRWCLSLHYSYQLRQVLPLAVSGLQIDLSSNKRCISVALGILQLFPLLLSCGRAMPFLSCSVCDHTVVTSYLEGMVRVFSLVEKGTVFVCVAGMGADDCPLM